MKTIFLVSFFAVVTFSAHSALAADSTYVCGINWFNIGDSLHQDSIIKLFSETIPFNMFHGGSDDSLVLSKFHGKFVYPQKPAINRLSGGERMLYQAIKHRTSFKENVNYYFSAIGHHIGQDYPNDSLPTHWEIHDSTVNTEVLVLDSNEFSGGVVPFLVESSVLKN